MITALRRFRSDLVPSLLALFLTITASGQSLVPPEVVGMSAQRLQRLTAEAQKQVETGKLPGIVSLVARRGNIVYLVAVGQQDRERGVPMKTDSIFRIASMTKPVTSLGVLTLYEDGKLQLTDPLSKYIPEFRNMQVWTPDETLVDADREITIYDLLTHNSGLGYHGNDPVGKQYVDAGIGNGVAPDNDSIGEDVRALAKIPLAQQPGSGFLYGLNSDVLGHVIEVVSGQSLAEFFEQHFFEPLGMRDTKFFLSDGDAPRLAQLYIRGEQGLLVPENRDLAVLDNNVPFGGKTPLGGPRISYSGGGGLCSTCEDYFRFCQMVLQKGQYDGKRILSRKSIEQASRPHLSLGNFFFSESSDFGLGYAVQRSAGTPRPGSPGTLRWGGVCCTTFFIDPQEQLIGISMAQLFPPDQEWLEQFQQLVYAAVDD